MIAKESCKLRKASTFARRRHDFRQAAARCFKLHPPPLSFGECFMKIRSAVPKNGCLMTDHQHSPFARRRHDFRQAAARRFISNYIPPPLSFGESFVKIRLAVPENGCFIVLVNQLFIVALVIQNYCQVHCSAIRKNAETEMSSIGAGKSVVTSLRPDCPAARSRSWRRQP